MTTKKSKKPASTAAGTGSTTKSKKKAVTPKVRPYSPLLIK